MLILVQPAQGVASPTVYFQAPTEGANVSGYLGGPGCEVSASSDTTAVDFYLDGQYVNHQGFAPWNCYFDSGTLSEGRHKLGAAARDARGGTSYAEVQIYTPVQPGTTTGAKATTRPVGSPPLSDAEAAARVKRSSFEPRPGNTKYNQTMPTDEQLKVWNANPDQSGFTNNTQVTGHFTGTTDEIIQWAAHKWGFDEDVFRAVCVVESWWNQTAGSGTDQGGGITSTTWAEHVGLFPIGYESTAFNIDAFAARMYFYYNGGATWMNTVERGQDYAAGDMWGSIGAWYVGRWHTAEAEWYIGRVKDDLAKRVWEERWF